MPAFISYIRVSTDGQGASGLGLEAQQAAVHSFIGDGDLIASYVEVESGRNNDRTQLALALEHCRKTKATLCVAKLDRLGRNVAFISRLMESRVPFVACDMPHASPFELHIRAALAEEEARLISRRTKDALAAAKARGVHCGRPAAPEAARTLAQSLRTGGASLRQVAEELRYRGFVGPAGKAYGAGSIQCMLGS